ncbi:MAG: hypothetical protein GY851_18130 [bacterium]|nr:hypothetical protein [bacterium]
MRTERIKEWAGPGVAAVWIFGSAAYFLVRFSLTFYDENRTAIEGVVEAIRGRL